RGKQSFDLKGSAIELLGDEQPIRCVVCAELKRIDATVVGPCCETVLQIVLKASGSLVAFLGGFREEFHHNLRNWLRKVLRFLDGRYCFSCNMTMDPLQGI